MAIYGEPVAIIGSACRFAGGASSPSKLWDLLLNPRDLSAPPPDTRFNLPGFYHENAHQSGRTNIHGSYFLDEDPRTFDAAFFNVSPKEAEAMDPQHRLLLELTYEAMEAAGLTLHGLGGSDTSVYVGLMIRDYMDIQARDPDYFSQYMVTGTSSALHANRISYFFDWHGPSLTVDTACSSSLVAVHQAVQGLRSGESRVACVAGTNLLFGPELFISAASMRMLSSQSRMWDVSAQGYARGDGVATLILKTLSNAIADGDHIDAVIRETGVNSDGRTMGITLPSPGAQATLIRDTYRRAGLDISKTRDRPQYFEAHGTGTQAGDPNEASAIHEAFFGEHIQLDEGTAKMWTGSIKTVVGHTEGTAGIAGMLKVMLAMKHRVIPPNLHFSELNPSVAPFYAHLQIPTEPVSWPEVAGAPLRASVNSFGFGGTNAHVIMESYETETETKPHMQLQSRDTALLTPLLFSANSEEALRIMVREYSAYLKTHGSSVSLRDLAYTLRSRRSLLPVKAFFSGISAAEVAQNMDERLNSGSDLGSRPKGVDSKPCVLGVFTGQGAQWPGMGKHLIQSCRLFSETIDRLEKDLAALPDGPDWSLRAEILAPLPGSRVAEAALAQPLCTAVAIALVDLLRASGVTFSAVVGHSSGEIGAAYAAGVISAGEAMQVAYYRGVCAELAAGGNGSSGGMLAVAMAFDEAAEFCGQPQFARRLGIAASNSISSVTLSGDIDAVKDAKDLLDTRQIFARQLRVDTAYHSHHMKPCMEPYMASLRSCDIRPKDPVDMQCTWVSSVCGSEGSPGPEELCATYWKDNMAQTVLFSQALERAMIECGPFDAAIEVGPHPILKGPASQVMAEVSGETMPYFGTLDRGGNDVVAFGNVLASLWLHCGPHLIDFEGYVATSEPKGVASLVLVKDCLPPYPWDHSQVFWRESRLSREHRLRAPPRHELLGHSMPSGCHEYVRWRNILRLDEMPWLGHHRIQGTAVVPTSAFSVMAIMAALELAVACEPKSDVDIVEVQSLEISDLVRVPEGCAGVELITSIQKLDIHDTDAVASAEFSILFGPPDGTQPLKRAVCARIVLFTDGLSADGGLEKTHKDDMDSLQMNKFYASIADMGLEYTGPFQALQSMHRRWRRSSALLRQSASADKTPMAVDPFIIESCVQAAYAAFAVPGDASLWSLFLPQGVKRMTVHLNALSRPDSWLEIDGLITEVTGSTATSCASFDADVECLDISTRRSVIDFEGLRISAFSPASADDDREIFLQTVWKRNSVGSIQLEDKRQSEGVAVAAQALEDQARSHLTSLQSDLDPHSFLTSPESRHLSESRHKESAAQSVTDTSPFTLDSDLPHMISSPIPATKGALRTFVEEHAVFVRLNFALHDAVAQIAHRFANLRVLEVGPSGLGPSKQAIAALGEAIDSYTFASTTAMVEEGSIAEVEYLVLDNLAFDQEALAVFSDGPKFDVIILSYLLHGRTSESIGKALSCLRHITKPGGYLLLLQHTKDYCWSRLFLNVLLTLEGDNRSLQDFGRPHSAANLDEALRTSGFSGVDSLLPSSADGPENAISLIVTQAVDERIDLIRRPLQPSAMSVIDDRALLIVGGDSILTNEVVQNLASALRPWASRVVIVDSFHGLDFDQSAFAGAIILTDIDRPLLQSLTPQAYIGITQLFQQIPHVLWVTSGALTDHPEQAASVGLGRSLSEDVPSLRLCFLDVELVEGSEERILSTFIRLLVSDLPDSADALRLHSFEGEIVVKDGCEMIPRVLPIRDMNDRLNSQRRCIKRRVSVDSPVLLIPHGALDAATYRAESMIATPDNRMAFTHSLPFAIKVSKGAYMYLFSGDTTDGPVLAFCRTLSTRGPAVTTWKTPVGCAISSVRLLEIASTALVARHICNLLPAGESIIFEPSQILACMMSDFTKGTRKNVSFITAGPSKPGKPWINIPMHASKRAIICALPKETQLFFNASRPSRLVARILGQLPSHARIYDRSELFRLSSETAKCAATASLELLLRDAGEFAVSAAQRMPDDSLSSLIDVADLLDGIPKLHSGLNMVDWRSITTTPILVEALNPATLFSSDKTYILVEVQPRLLRSILDWLISHRVRNVLIIDRTITKWKGQEFSSIGVSIQFAAVDLTNASVIRSLINTLPNVSGAIYDGAVAQADNLQEWKDNIQGSRNLTEALIPREPEFFLILSSLESQCSPAGAYLASLASQARVRGLPACFIHLNKPWASGKLLDSPYMPTSESDLHYILAEAIHSCRSKHHDHGTLLTALKRIDKRDARVPSCSKWLSQALFSHHTVRQSDSHAVGGQNHPQSLQEKLALCYDPRTASAIIWESFSAKISVLLNFALDSIHSSHDLASLGADSLTASEIRSWFLEEMKVDVSVLKVLGGLTIAELCDEVAANMTFASAQVEDSPTPDAPQPTVAYAAVEEESRPESREAVLACGSETNSESSAALFSTAAINTPVTNTSGEVDYFRCRTVEEQSLNQRRLWFPSVYLDQETPFNCTTSYTLSGPIDAVRLDIAFQQVVQRHESFRTAFSNDETTGEPMQSIQRSSPFSLKVMVGTRTEDYEREFDRIHTYRFNLATAETFVATLITHSLTEHTLITGYHHIIMDGVSWQITLNDLAKFYEAQTPRLPAMAQYTDFTVKQSQLVANNSHAQKLAFWKKVFPTAPALMPILPFAKVKTRKVLTSYDTLDIVLDIEASLVAKIKEASLGAKATSFHLYLSAFVVLLNRCLDMDEVCLGIIDANRSDKMFLNTVGFLLDLLPLKLKVNKRERFVHTMKNTRSMAYSALEHSGVPLESILQHLRVPASSTNTPMFQVLINYRRGALRAPQMGKAKMNFLCYQDAKAPFDLAISIDEKDDGTGMLSFSLQEYMFDREGAERLVSTYAHLLEMLSHDPSQRMSDVPLFNESLSMEALAAGTGAILDLGWPNTETISQRADWQMKRHPDRLAVRDLSGKSRTYLETWKRVNALAATLSEAGITHGSRVAVYCEPTVDVIACILAIHRVGAACVPLDVRNSPERLGAVVRECDPDLVLCDSDTAERALGFVPPGRAMLDVGTVAESTELVVPNLSRLSDDAFILYTSGSTGKPKGITLSQANISIHCASVSNKLKLTHEDVFLQQSALGFDASLGQMVYAIANGGALILGSNRGDLRHLAMLMEKEKVTLTLFIVSELSALLQQGSDILSRCTSWRISLCGGEAFTSRLLPKVRALGLPNLALYNAYGPTEGTIIASIGAVPYDEGVGDDFTVPCGPPLPNYGVYVCDERLQPVPIGWPGELCIAGPCVATGYLGQPALTDAKFRPDGMKRPNHASGACEGWSTLYRTGDRARMHKDGSFVFLGRIDGDSQVKLRGIRIELGEITGAIIEASEGAISDAATIVRETAQTLVSFVVLSPNRERLADSPKAYLRKLVQSLPLPIYMRPAIAIPLDALPLTERGKLDTRALNAYSLEQQQEEEEEGVIELTETELKLKDVWRAILPYEDLAMQIRKDYDFFSAGGNSLLLIRLQAAIRDVFSIEVPLVDLFQASTLEALASRLDASLHTGSRDTEIDWEAETTLDATLPPARAIAVGGAPMTVILTGSTGLLGRELVRQLIANPLIGRIHCLAVRPGRTPPSSDKVIPHVGDLAAPLLGLTADEAHDIFSTASAIIHNGAQVSHMKSYASLRATNVGSTAQLIELALHTAHESCVPVPTFHYVSSAGVGVLVGAPEFAEVSISRYPPATQGPNGYVAAKFASECLLERAARLGLPVTIHRPSSISGPDVGERDIVHSVWRFSEKMRAVPDLVAAGATGAFDFVKLETCAAGIVGSVLAEHGRGVRYLHHSGDRVVPVASLGESLGERVGVDIAVLPFDEWVDRAVGCGMDELVAVFLRQTKGAFAMPLLVKAGQAIKSRTHICCDI